MDDRTAPESLPFTEETNARLEPRDDETTPTAFEPSPLVRSLRQYAADSDKLAEQHAEAIADGGYSAELHFSLGNGDGTRRNACGVKSFTAATATTKQRIERSTCFVGNVTCLACLATLKRAEDGLKLAGARRLGRSPEAAERYREAVWLAEQDAQVARDVEESKERHRADDAAALAAVAGGAR